MKDLKEFKPLIKLMKDEKGKLIVASIIVVICGFCEIFSGYLNGRSVESITNMDIENALTYLGLYFLLGITTDGVLYLKAKSILSKLESVLTRKLEFYTYKKAINLPAVAFEKMSSGEIISRITSDANTLSFVFLRLLNMVTMLVTSFVLLIYIFINSWLIGLEIVIIIVILYFVIKKYNPILENIHRERKKEQDKFISLTNESIRGIREIKTLGVKNNLINNVVDIIKKIFDKSSKEIDIKKDFDIITGFIKTVLECGVIGTCAVLLYYQKISLTFLIAMTYYVYRYTSLIENINDLIQTYQSVKVSVSRVNDILDNRIFDDEKFGTKKLENVKGVIKFDKVSFAYPDEDETLNNFNLIVEPNKKVAIVGASGQGKSTLFNLLTRIFDVSDGEILIDDVNIKELKEDELRKNISIIRQEPFIFNRSIKENFLIVDENLSLDDIRKYCKMAYLDDYIMSLPKGYDTILGEGGVNLSGGQRQRLSIARTLSRNSKIILFDEATSALDNNSQNYIKKTIDDLVSDHTVVIVAHRLSTIMDADVIHVVDKGKVVATGKHKELLKTCELYKNLYLNESLNS
mgnify:FL=1